MFGLFKSKKKSNEIDPKVTMFIAAGIEYFKKRDYESSKKYFERVLEIEPQNCEAHNYLHTVTQKINQEIMKKSSQESTEIETAILQKEEIGIDKINSLKNETKDRQFYYKLLRLEHNAAPDDIKEAIASEFKKWRTRVNSPDINKRFEAEEMLDLISQAKRVLL